MIQPEGNSQRNLRQYPTWLKKGEYYKRAAAHYNSMRNAFLLVLVPLHLLVKAQFLPRIVLRRARFARRRRSAALSKLHILSIYGRPLTPLLTSSFHSFLSSSGSRHVGHMRLSIGAHINSSTFLDAQTAQQAPLSALKSTQDFVQ